MKYAFTSIVNFKFGNQRKINDNSVHLAVSSRIFFISRASLDQTPMFAFYLFKVIKNHFFVKKKQVFRVRDAILWGKCSTRWKHDKQLSIFSLR